MLRPQVDLLQVPAAAQVEEVQPVPVPLAEQQLADQPVLDHRRRAPLAGDHDVGAQVPPEVVGEVLRPALLLPAAEHLERVVVEQGDAARPLVAVRRAEVGDVDALGTAVRGVRAAVAGLVLVLLRFDHLGDARVAGVVLDVDDVHPARPQPEHEQVAALDVGVRVAGAQRRAARVPAVVVQLVADVRHVAPADDLPVRRRAGVDVHDGEGVGLRLALAAPERGDVRQALGLGLRSQAGRGVEGGVGLPAGLRHRGSAPRGRERRAGAPRKDVRGSHPVGSPSPTQDPGRRRVDGQAGSSPRTSGQLAAKPGCRTCRSTSSSGTHATAVLSQSRAWTSSRDAARPSTVV